MALLVLTHNISYAHGLPRVQHNGLTATALDLGFEIFNKAGLVNVFVTDHDSPFDTKIFSAELRVSGRVILLHSEPGGFLRSVRTEKPLEFNAATLVLKASVLPEAITVKF